jgi:hypothetical protein
MTIHLMSRRDIAADWTTDNPVLYLGEQGLEMDTRMYKVGDGITAWNDLPYWGGGSSRIQVKTVTTGGYTLTAADEDFLILFTNVNGCLVTGPANSEIPIGFICHLHQETAGEFVTVEFTPAAGAAALTAIGLCTRTQYSSMSIIVQAENTYKIIGDVKLCEIGG